MMDSLCKPGCSFSQNIGFDVKLTFSTAPQKGLKCDICGQTCVHLEVLKCCNFCILVDTVAS